MGYKIKMRYVMKDFIQKSLGLETFIEDVEAWEILQISEVGVGALTFFWE